MSTLEEITTLYREHSEAMDDLRQANLTHMTRAAQLCSRMVEDHRQLYEAFQAAKPYLPAEVLVRLALAGQKVHSDTEEVCEATQDLFTDLRGMVVGMQQLIVILQSVTALIPDDHN